MDRSGEMRDLSTFVVAVLCPSSQTLRTFILAIHRRTLAVGITKAIKLLTTLHSAEESILLSL